MENKSQTPAKIVMKEITEEVLTRVNEMQETKSLTLPSDYSPENAIRAAYLVLQDVKDKNGNPALQVCTKTSISNSFLKMVVGGLNPIKRQCYFIVRGKELCCDESYFGVIAQAKRFADVENVFGVAIFKGDSFKYEIDPETGRKKVVEHKQSLDSLGGEVIGAYAVVIKKDGSKNTEIMNMKQIRKAWEQGAMNGNSPAHKNFPDQMSIRSAITRACKIEINSSSDNYLIEGNDPETAEETAERTIKENANKEIVDFYDAEEVTQEEEQKVIDIHEDEPQATEQKPEPEQEKESHVNDPDFEIREAERNEVKDLKQAQEYLVRWNICNPEDVSTMVKTTKAIKDSGIEFPNFKGPAF